MFVRRFFLGFLSTCAVASTVAQDFDTIFTFDEPTITYQSVVSDGVRNTYAAGVRSGKVVVQKLDELGAEVWETEFPATVASRVFKIILDANQDIYVAATEGATDRVALLLSLNRSDGAIRWTSSIDCEDINQFVDIAAGKSGNSVLLYQLVHVGVGSNTNTLVRRLSPTSGAQVWERTLAGGLGKRTHRLGS